jgi:dolichol-phosphate mannosyltransferase
VTSPAPVPRAERIPDLSIVVPVVNEEENVLPMLEEIRAQSASWPWSWELIFVDDGSTDQTWERIREAREKEPRVRAVRFQRNCGQTSAVAAGVRHGRAAICITLDGDCQNDPADIPKLVEKLRECDFVIGWRRQRQDTPWRRFQSRFANGFRNLMTGERVNDIGCGIKAFDREKMLSIPLFEGMHRFMPTLFRYKGWRVAEVEVGHRPRARGETKYGMWNRVFRSLRDLFAVRWMKWRMIRYELRDEDTLD